MTWIGSDRGRAGWSEPIWHAVGAERKLKRWATVEKTAGRARLGTVFLSWYLVAMPVTTPSVCSMLIASRRDWLIGASSAYSLLPDNIVADRVQHSSIVVVRE